MEIHADFLINGNLRLSITLNVLLTRNGSQMDDLLSLLQQIGLGVACNAVYDILKRHAAQPLPTQTLAVEIENAIRVHGVTMKAATVIDALAANGVLSIQQSKLHAPDAITFGSIQGAAIVGNSSKLTTKNTAIEAGRGAFVQTSGNAQIRQNPDGSISFHVGENGGDSISIHT
ncbi:hypothetical protein A6X21_18875 [Planctopirus hydrillae]|uniref:Uncharacterized protein n=2 Tax=Planctopirus hydrillae TaxID=1841610 RepID=A0A1C3EJF8_9PLAN|nr:hypothetical protein A6X21_18875 [Planctopirus hydrillae]